jgi:hypothetical protein
VSVRTYSDSSHQQIIVTVLPGSRQDNIYVTCNQALRNGAEKRACRLCSAHMSFFLASRNVFFGQFFSPLSRLLSLKEVEIQMRGLLPN